MKTDREDKERMIAVSMTLLQHVISAPVARAVVLSRSCLAVSLTQRRKLSVSSSSSSRAPRVDANVLLGMSEQELQKLAVDLGQVQSNQIKKKKRKHFLFLLLNKNSSFFFFFLKFVI